MLCHLVETQLGPQADSEVHHDSPSR
jgi:hypothetical protein